MDVISPLPVKRGSALRAPHKYVIGTSCTFSSSAYLQTWFSDTRYWGSPPIAVCLISVWFELLPYKRNLTGSSNRTLPFLNHFFWKASDIYYTAWQSGFLTSSRLMIHLSFFSQLILQNVSCFSVSARIATDSHASSSVLSAHRPNLLRAVCEHQKCNTAAITCVWTEAALIC